MNSDLNYNQTSFSSGEPACSCVFRTPDTYIAAFLCVKGFELLYVEPYGYSEGPCFLFNASPEIYSLIKKLNSAEEGLTEVLVDVRKFIVAIELVEKRFHEEVYG